MSKATRTLDDRAVLFCRIGWAEHYQGKERLVGGGRWNRDHVGGEVTNYLAHKGNVYGYFSPNNKDIVNLERILPSVEGDVCHGVTLAFVATHPLPEGGQRLIGWYTDATIFRTLQNPPTRYHSWWHAKAKEENAVLLPIFARTLRVPPREKGGFGRANVRYLFDSRGVHAVPEWARAVLAFIDGYSGPNLLAEPGADAVNELVHEVEEACAGQGRLSVPERRAVEEHAVKCASRYLKRNGYENIDTSPQASLPYDIQCTKGRRQVTIEVKGTTGAGGRVILTRNEVVHARSHPQTHALLIVHGIRLEGGRKPKASGGRVRMFGPPFSPSADSLSPLAYDFAVQDT